MTSYWPSATGRIMPTARPLASAKVLIVTMPSMSSISWRASGRDLSTAARIHSRSRGATVSAKRNVAARTAGSSRCSLAPQPASVTVAQVASKGSARRSCMG